MRIAGVKPAWPDLVKREAGASPARTRRCKKGVGTCVWKRYYFYMHMSLARDKSWEDWGRR